MVCSNLLQIHVNNKSVATCYRFFIYGKGTNAVHICFTINHCDTDTLLFSWPSGDIAWGLCQIRLWKGIQDDYRCWKIRWISCFLYLVIALSAITIGSFSLWKAIFSYDARTRYKTRFKTLEERKRVSRIAGRHESKKGLQRLEFDREGHNLQNNTFRGRIDTLFDPLKHLWNDLITTLKLSDVHKFNTLHVWKIGEPRIIIRQPE